MLVYIKWNHLISKYVSADYFALSFTNCSEGIFKCNEIKTDLVAKYLITSIPLYLPFTYTKNDYYEFEKQYLCYLPIGK